MVILLAFDLWFYRLLADKYTHMQYPYYNTSVEHSIPHFTVASLGWVTSGEATEGVTPLLLPEKPGDLFSRQSAVSPLFIFT